jgi:hypothetical protein
VKRIGLLLPGLLFVAGWVAGQATQRAQTAQQKWPSVLPRAETIKLYEDDRVVVWDDNLATEHFMHKHVRDSIYFSVQDGPVEAVDVTGKVTSTSDGRDRAGTVLPVPRFGAFSKAGNGPHSERSLDPNKRRRMFRIEFKGSEPPDCKDWSTDPACK